MYIQSAAVNENKGRRGTGIGTVSSTGSGGQSNHLYKPYGAGNTLTSTAAQSNERRKDCPCHITYKSILLARAEVKFLGSDIDENIESLLDQIRLSSVSVSCLTRCVCQSGLCLRSSRVVTHYQCNCRVGVCAYSHHLTPNRGHGTGFSLLIKPCPALSALPSLVPNRRSSCTRFSCAATSAAWRRSAKRRDAGCWRIPQDPSRCKNSGVRSI